MLFCGETFVVLSGPAISQELFFKWTGIIGRKHGLAPVLERPAL